MKDSELKVPLVNLGDSDDSGYQQLDDLEATTDELKQALLAISEHVKPGNSRRTRQTAFVLSLICSLSNAPVTFDFGERFEASNEALGIFFGTASSSAVCSLLLKLNYDTFLKFNNATNLAEVKKLIRQEPKCSRRLVVTALWVSAVIGALPMVYLNDKYVHWIFDLPIAVSISSAYRFSQANFYRNTNNLILNNAFFSLGSQKTLELMKKRNELTLKFQKISQAVQSMPDNKLETIFTNARTYRRNRNDEKIVPLETDFLVVFKDILDYTQAQQEQKSQSSRSSALVRGLNFAVGRIGNLIGAVGVYAYYVVGSEAIPYFARQYFGTSGSGYEDSSKAVGGISFYCHATLGGWATGRVFQKAFMFFYSKLFARPDCQMKLSRQDAWDACTSLTPFVLKSLFSSASAIMRVEVTAEETSSTFITLCAFFSVFGLSYVGYSNLVNMIKRSKHNGLKALVLNMATEITPLIADMEERHLNVMYGELVGP